MHLKDWLNSHFKHFTPPTFIRNVSNGIILWVTGKSSCFCCCDWFIPSSQNLSLALPAYTTRITRRWCCVFQRSSRQACASEEGDNFFHHTRLFFLSLNHSHCSSCIARTVTPNGHVTSPSLCPSEGQELAVICLDVSEVYYLDTPFLCQGKMISALSPFKKGNKAAQLELPVFLALVKFNLVQFFQSVSWVLQFATICISLTFNWSLLNIIWHFIFQLWQHL